MSFPVPAWSHDNLPASEETRMPDGLSPEQAAAWQAAHQGLVDQKNSELEPSLPPDLHISISGIVTVRKKAIQWDLVTGATGYQVQFSRQADFSDTVYDKTFDANHMELPDFSNGDFYIRVRAVGGTGGQNTPVTEWTAGTRFTVNVAYSPYQVPLNYAHGGIDANIIDWDPSSDPAAQSFQVFRRDFGSGHDWELVATLTDSGVCRYIDSTIDPGSAYEYKVIRTDVNGASQQLDPRISNNYSPAITPVNPIPTLTNNRTLTVTYRVDGGADQTVTFDLTEGLNHGLTITVIDEAGNQTVYTLPDITLDTIAPAVVLPAGLNGYSTGCSALNMFYFVNGVYKSARFDLAEGINHLQIVETDGAGNYTTVAFDVTYNPALQPTSNPYVIPPCAADGGTDVNIIDWTPGGEGNGGWTVYRRVLFSGAEWQLIATLADSQASRYVDLNIDSDVTYEYKIISGCGMDKSFRVSTNYAVDSGLKPQNVLVLINTRAGGIGYVNIADVVPGAGDVNGALDPITEQQIMTYLGYTFVGGVWKDASGNDAWYCPTPGGDSYLLAWHLIKHADGSIDAPLGVYYAFRRDIPKKNIVFVDAPTGERDYIGIEGDPVFDALIQTIHDHMAANGIVDKIYSIVSSYHFPIVFGGQWYLDFPGPENVSWEYGLGRALWKSFTGNYSPSEGNYNRGVRFSRKLGFTGFMATRIDAENIGIAKRMIDDAIWAERNFTLRGPGWIQQAGLRAFVDWQGIYGDIDLWFLDAAEILGSSGLFGTQGGNWDLAPEIDSAWLAAHPEYDLDHDGRLDSTFLAIGWYHFGTSRTLGYNDMYNYARGAISWDYDSSSACSYRNYVFWGHEAIRLGSAVSLGAVNEPSISHTRPQYFMMYLLNGYSFAEASYLSTSSAYAMSFDGDPLYNPFGGDNESVTIVDMNGQPVERHVYGSQIIGSRVARVYRDYDAFGRLVREQDNAGNIILYLDDGRTAIYNSLANGLDYYISPDDLGAGDRDISDYITLCVFDADGRRSSCYIIPPAADDLVSEELVPFADGSIRVVRHFEDGRTETFTQEGFLVQHDAQGAETAYHVVKPSYSYNAARRYWTASYTEVGTAHYISRTAGNIERNVVDHIDLQAGGTLTWVYDDPGSFDATRIDFSGSGGALLSQAFAAGGGNFEMRAAGTGSVLSQMPFFSCMSNMYYIVKCFEWTRVMIPEMQNAMTMSANIVAAIKGIDAAAVLSQIAYYVIEDMKILFMYTMPNFTPGQPDLERGYILPYTLLDGTVIIAMRNNGGGWYVNIAPGDLPSEIGINVDAQGRISGGYWWEYVTGNRYILEGFRYDGQGRLVSYATRVSNDGWQRLGTAAVYYCDPVTGTGYEVARPGAAVPSAWEVFVGNPQRGSISLTTARELVARYLPNEQVEYVIDAACALSPGTRFLANQASWTVTFSPDGGITTETRTFALAEGVNRGLVITGTLPEGKAYRIELPDITLDTAQPVIKYTPGPVISPYTPRPDTPVMAISMSQLLARYNMMEKFMTKSDGSWLIRHYAGVPAIGIRYALESISSEEKYIALAPLEEGSVPARKS
jgi:uncharacterized protein (TIGR03790 family)